MKPETIHFILIKMRFKKGGQLWLIQDKSLPIQYLVYEVIC